MMPKLTKYLQNIDKNLFVTHILNRTNGIRDLTQDIVQETIISSKNISRGDEVEFIEEIIEKLKNE